MKTDYEYFTAVKDDQASADLRRIHKLLKDDPSLKDVIKARKLVEEKIEEYEKRRL